MSGLVIGCGGDSGGDDGASTADDSTTATTPSSATETGGQTQATVTDTDSDASVTVTETSAATDPGDSSGGTTGPGDSTDGGEGSTTEAVVSASATLEPKSGSNTMGTAVFTDNGDGTVSLVVELTGVEPVSAMHGLHIHETPDCSAEDGTSTGNHWNPRGTTLGELGNVDIAADGTGTFMKMDAWSIGTGRVNDVVDHAIIIHADPDGGTRIACGVIALD